MGLLAKPSHGGLFTRRGGGFALVAGLHALALVVAINMRAPADEPVEVAAIKVAFLDESTQQEAPPELPQLKVEPPPPPDIQMPVVLIPVIDVPDTRAITAPPQPPPPAIKQVVAKSDEPVMLDVDQVDYIRMPEPRYPRAAKQARLQGTVMVWVLIGTDGRAREVKVHRSSGYEQLDREGCDAVLNTQFKPYRLHGEARIAQAIVPIEFALTRRGGGPDRGDKPDRRNSPG
jgi:protein TonB